jgi:hypothetical protein
MRCRAAPGTLPATSRPTATSIRACNSRCRRATSGRRRSRRSGMARRSSTRCARSASRICRRARRAASSRRARGARGWPTWKATCAGHRLRDARARGRRRVPAGEEAVRQTDLRARRCLRNDRARVRQGQSNGASVQSGAEDVLTDAHGRARAAVLREVLHRFRRARLRAHGRSMRPAIEPGDVLSIAHVDASELAIGDVVLFDRGGRLFAHRAIARGDRAWITRGDAHEQSDPSVPDANVLGVVTHITRDRSLRAAVGRLRTGRWIVGRLEHVPHLVRRYCTPWDRRSSVRASAIRPAARTCRG